MARKRDYKAEYRARKLKAAKSGYKSVRQYKAARKAGSVPRGAEPVRPRQMARTVGGDFKRQTVRNWSRKHSHVKSTHYLPSWTDKQVDDFFNAYIAQPSEDNETVKKDIWRYHRDYYGDDKEWSEDWKSHFSTQ